MKKTGKIDRFLKNLRSSLPVSVIMAFLWLVLGWLRSVGVHSILLYPLNFLTGALAGLDGGSVIGGTVGKTLLLLMVNSFVRTALVRRGDLHSRIKAGWKAFYQAALRKIPQYSNVKQLFTKEYWRLAFNGMGFGMALLGYAFLTGNGSFQNSFLCVLLFAQSSSALFKQRGLIIVAANRLLGWLGVPAVDRDAVNRLVGGNALGYFLAVGWAAAFDTAGWLGWLGSILMIGCAAYLIHRMRSVRKETLSSEKK